MKETAAKVLFFSAACVAILAVGTICAFLFANGLPALQEIGVFDFLLGKNWRPGNDLYGIFPMLLGSVYATAGAMVVGVPLGILTATYLAMFAGKRTKRLLQPAVNLLAGIPSVVYGYFGMMVLVPFVRSVFGGRGTSLLTASLLLGIMILPTVISVAKSSIAAVEKNYYEGAVALGATHERAVFRVVLPAAKSGLVTAVALGIGRAVGETMAVVMIAGNQARMPVGLLSGVRTLTANIVLEMGYAADLHRSALIATAMVLFLFILVINLLLTVMRGRKAK